MLVGFYACNRYLEIICQDEQNIVLSFTIPTMVWFLRERGNVRFGIDKNLSVSSVEVNWRQRMPRKRKVVSSNPASCRICFGFFCFKGLGETRIPVQIYNTIRFGIVMHSIINLKFGYDFSFILISVQNDYNECLANNNDYF